MNKIPDKDKKAAHQRATLIGGAKGFVGGLAFAAPASLILQRRWAYYRSLPPSLKAFGIITVVVPAFVISAERAALAFERTQWTDTGMSELEMLQARAQAKWDSMKTTEKVGDWAARHQYSIIGGSWACSMVGAYAWISRDRYLTPLQKIVQTRVWAQGLTLGVIIAAAALTHGHSVRSKGVDHSWRDMLALEEEKERNNK